MKIFNTIIDTKSFFKKGIKSNSDDFGIYLITGYQGSGKTYFGIYLLNQLKPELKIYTNIKSLRISGRNIEYFEKIEDITSNIEEDRIFIIDELSKKYTKESKQDKLFYSWLQQSRKRKRIVFLITQEYLQVPIWLRGIARFVYTTNKLPLFPIFITRKGLPVLNDDMEWTITPTLSFIYKRNKFIASQYDTMEPVNTL